MIFSAVFPQYCVAPPRNIAYCFVGTPCLAKKHRKNINAAAVRNTALRILTIPHIDLPARPFGYKCPCDGSLSLPTFAD